MKTKSIQLFSQPVEFFRTQVTKAIKNQKLQVSYETEFYLVSLLAQFMPTQIFQKSTELPLAIALHKAMSSNKAARILLLRELGDFSLYISGFFPDSLQRSLVDVDYYIAMGESAYLKLSYEAQPSTLITTFRDLCEHFITYVDILGEVSDSAFFHTSQDILRTYEKWIKTKSQRLEQLLRTEGVSLDPALYKKSQ